MLLFRTHKTNPKLKHQITVQNKFIAVKVQVSFIKLKRFNNWVLVKKNNNVSNKVKINKHILVKPIGTDLFIASQDKAQLYLFLSKLNKLSFYKLTFTSLISN